jgi:F-type H+-transporting ATPase subunit b
VLTATVTGHGGFLSVVVSPMQGDDNGEEDNAATNNQETTTVREGPSPIVPEPHELAWSAGAFVVFALLMRYVLYPRLRKGMDARYNAIRTRLSDADSARVSAKSEVAEYERQLAGVRAEASALVEAARQELEADRRTQLAASNARLAQERAAAAEQDEAARAAVRDQVESAVVDVATRAVELATGTRPSPEVVERAVRDQMSVGVGR